ncbi:MAG: hypothetical protein OXB96_00535 [Candidatus Kaiserbacteria bacterium]|nr:hypothetical protein [Candidatus Kaiserbacteria bacterium]
MEKNQKTSHKVMYTKKALKIIDEMDKKYDFGGRNNTLSFALHALKQLDKHGRIS